MPVNAADVVFKVIDTLTVWPRVSQRVQMTDFIISLYSNFNRILYMLKHILMPKMNNLLLH